jgi:hypothetical protein
MEKPKILDSWNANEKQRLRAEIKQLETELNGTENFALMKRYIDAQIQLYLCYLRRD